MIDDLPDKKSIKKKSVLTNPTLMGWLTLVGLPLGIWGVYLSYAFNKHPNPIYKVISDVVITESRLDSKIKVYYDSVEVKNVRAVTIALWNAGNDFLDKNAISKDKPITISSDKSISILEFRTIKNSRTGLAIQPTLYVDNVVGTPVDSTESQSDYVNLEIEGDEGLEAQDGITCQILYTSRANACQWFVEARIKGIPQGFIVAIGSAPLASAIINLGMPLLMILGLTWVYSKLDLNYPNQSNTPRISKVAYLLIYSLYIVGAAYIVYNYVIPYYPNSVDVPQTLLP